MTKTNGLKWKNGICICLALLIILGTLPADLFVMTSRAANTDSGIEEPLSEGPGGLEEEREPEDENEPFPDEEGPLGELPTLIPYGLEEDEEKVVEVTIGSKTERYPFERLQDAVKEAANNGVELMLIGDVRGCDIFVPAGKVLKVRTNGYYWGAYNKGDGQMVDADARSATVELAVEDAVLVESESANKKTVADKSEINVTVKIKNIDCFVGAYVVFTADTHFFLKEGALPEGWTRKGTTFTYDNNDGSEIQVSEDGYSIGTLTFIARTSAAEPKKTQAYLTVDEDWTQVVLNRNDAGDTFPAQKCETINGMITIIRDSVVRFETGNFATVIEDQFVPAQGTAVRPEDPTRKGYTFGDWYTDETYQTAYDFDCIVSEDVTVYAKWEANKYKITFEPGEGVTLDASKREKEVLYDVPVGEMPEPVKEESFFWGWMYGEKLISKDTIYSFDSDITVRPKWYPEYKISYELNGGSWDEGLSNPTIYYEKSETIVLKNPIRPGYIFDGWYESEEYTGTSVTQIEKGSTGDKKFYARWNLAEGRPFNNVTLTLTGSIGLNFFLDLDAYDDVASVQITYSKPTTEEGVKLTDTYSKGHWTTVIGEEGYPRYKFTIYAAAAQMADVTTVAIFNSQGQQVDDTIKISIRDMVEQYILDDKATAELKNLGKAMVTYGGYAQSYFNYNVSDLAYYGKTVNGPENISTINKNTITSVAQATQGATGFGLDSTSFVALAESAIRLYYTLENGAAESDFEITATLDGQRLSDETRTKIRTGENGQSREKFIEVYDISGSDLDAEIIVTICHTSSGTETVAQYNPMCFAKAKIIATGTAEALKLSNMCKAMYLYNDKANTYFEKHGWEDWSNNG